jgi:hypothetical protein
VRPVGQPRGDRYGRCRLCGEELRLSQTHVPAKGAGNRGEARRAVERIDEGGGVPTLDLGRPTLGGMWGYWFCVECNHRTGVWDEEYIRLHQHLILHLHNGPERPRQRLMGTLPQLDIGAIARSMRAWSFALVPTLLDRYPAIARAVRTGEAAEVPDDVDLLLGITMSLRLWATAQPDAWLVESDPSGVRRRPSGLLVRGPNVELLPITAVASPPFSVVLAHGGRPSGVPHAVVNEWLRDPAGARRDVVFDLPMIVVRSEDGPGPLGYARFMPAPAASA